MNDIKKDPFEEYIRQIEPEELGYAWYTAIGLQAVDGLKTSAYLKKAARDNIDGKISIQAANKLIESYYSENPKCDEEGSKEADIVSARIAVILSEKAFTFSVPQYIGIHKRLFEGIYVHAGKVRDYPHLAKFVSGLWQIHAFGEGNTRTTAVFFIKYLRTMGFQVTNDIFAENAWYFRNALVRANYNDFSKGIRETTEFLELFLRNLLLGEHNELHNRQLHVRWKTLNQDLRAKNQAIERGKPDIGKSKQDIKIPETIGNKTKKHIQDLFEEFGYDTFFGRTEVMQVLNLTASPASELIKKMSNHKLIYPIKGKGKGKYLFTK